ncbi:MAG: hypothetical protein ACFFD4_30905 [Candidatus Odinarchaeota archaeon]
MSDDYTGRLIRSIKSQFDLVENQTYHQHEDEIAELLNDIRKGTSYRIRDLLKNLHGIGLDESDSLLFTRTIEYFGQVNGIFLSIISGLYHQAMREMRFLIESWVLAYYIDKKYPLDTLKEKIEVDDDSTNLYGNRLLARVFGPEKSDNKTKFQKIVNELNKVVHPSKKELKRYIKSVDGTFTGPQFFYQKEMVDRCLVLLREVHDLLMLLLN